MNNFQQFFGRVGLFTIVAYLCSGIVYSQNDTNKNRLDYHFSWDGKSSILKVELFYHTHNADSTVFVFGNPNPGGLTNIFDILVNPGIDHGDSLSVNTSDRKLVVRHNTQGVKKLNYEIDGTPVLDPKRARPNEAFRPSIAPGFFYSLGYNLFMDVADSTFTDVTFVWDSWPEQMPYFVSLDPEAKPGHRQMVAHAERNGVLIQMNQNLQRKKYDINKIPTYLITSKSGDGNDMQQGMDSLVARFIPGIREFWQDYDFKFYFLSMIPLLTEVPSTMTGIGLNNGFGTRYSGPLDTEKMVTIAHEISHSWIGVRMGIKSKTMENTWFSEGFNDYIAIYNLVRSGLFDQTAFLNYVNKEILRPHYTNPENKTPADSIEMNFWKNKNFEKIPYHRGFIYALYLDHQIRLATNSKKGLRDFLLILYNQNGKSKEKVLTVADFIEALSAFLPKEQIELEVKNYMHDGQLLDFRKIKLINSFLVNYDDQVPQISFSGKSDFSSFYK